MKDSKAIPIGNWECHWDGEHAIIAPNPMHDSDGYMSTATQLVFHPDGGFSGRGKHGAFCDVRPKVVEMVDEDANTAWQWIHGVGRDGKKYTMFQHPLSGISVEIPRLEVKRMIVLMPLEEVGNASLLSCIEHALSINACVHSAGPVHRV